MILRRVIRHFKNQEWTAIFIDFCIVVIGVFVGIQVSNWNEARVELGLVRGHLSEIAQDLRTHIALSDELERSIKLRIAAVDYIHREAFGTRLPTTLVRATEHWEVPTVEPFPPDQLDYLMGSVNLIKVSARSRNGYEAMTSAGRLGLLKNRQLALQIQTYYGQYDEFLDAQGQVFRPFRNDGAREFYALGLSTFDQRPAAEIVALARDNKGFAAYLRSQREWAITNEHLLQNINRATKSLLASIDKELNVP